MEGRRFFWGGSPDAGTESAGEEQCSYTKVRRRKCSILQNEELGKPVKKCEKTEELLRRCSGRPVEVVESTSEITEEDLTNDASIGQDDYINMDQGHMDLHQFFHDEASQGYSRPIPRFFEYQDKQPDPHLGGLADFLHAAEEMTSKIFGTFGVYSPDHGGPWLFSENHSSHEHMGKEKLREPYFSRNSPRDVPHKKPQFSEYSKDFQEI